MVAPLEFSSSLEETYAIAAATARRAVAARYYLTAVDLSDPDYPAPKEHWREVWRLEIDAWAEVPREPDQQPFELLAAIPLVFPDELPSMFATLEEVKRAGVIPHLNDGRFICTFDKSEAYPNADDPGGIVLAAIERGVRIWREGLAGSNAPDFQEEFGAYWRLGCTSSAYSLVMPTGTAREVVGISMGERWGTDKMLFCNMESEGEHWLAATGYAGTTRKGPVLYLPLITLGAPPFPATNGEVFDAIRKFSAPSLRALSRFLQSQPRPTCILFSVETGKGAAMGAWWHPTFSHRIYRGRSGGREVPGFIPGFRPSTKGSSSAAVELGGRHRDGKLVRVEVTRVDAHRLYGRTSGRVSTTLEQPANIIGCGSIGGLLAEALARSGVATKLRLVDPEVLLAENTPRHYCGMGVVDKPKVTVMAAKLTAHFPHIVCERHQQNVLELLRLKPGALRPASLTIVALGDIAVERRLNKLSLSGSNGDLALVPPPVCYAWVEPFLYGGHAVYIQDPTRSCFECAFDARLNFKYGVLSDPGTYSRREAGCQTTFVPYSGVDAQQFASMLARFLIDGMGSSDNSMFTWAGDLDRARRDGVGLNLPWAEAMPFSTRTEVLTRDPVCLGCGQ